MEDKIKRPKELIRKAKDSEVQNDKAQNSWWRKYSSKYTKAKKR